MEGAHNGRAWAATTATCLLLDPGEMHQKLRYPKWVYLSFLLMMLGHSYSSSRHMTVDPPHNLKIVDPGFLGHLNLQWQPPLTLGMFQHCTVQYELRYRNVDSEDWETIITKKLNYEDGFDLNQGVEAKIQTLLTGHCTNGSDVHSKWIQTSFWIPLQGEPETKIQEMQCINYNWKSLHCTWKPGEKIPKGANYNLYYWYKGLDRAVQCADYIESNGRHVGCQFPSMELAEYQDFNICVNGSSLALPLRASYFSFQLQNIVKPSPPEQLNLTQRNPEELHLEWKPPEGPVPSHCLTYEVQFQEDDASWVSRSTEKEMITLQKSNGSRRFCIWVRDKVNIYCANEGFWSEWSSQQCLEEQQDDDSWLLFIIIPVTLIMLNAILVASLLVQKQRTCLKQVLGKKEVHFYHEAIY
ncbi:interleukin-13 receptor subunit alpha-2 [Antechinus flavipes]|uniref:interleukin-13 receptor subunit alpha-2 n=1 Tax=Antechinus flavipes TaxID=38775 RepID=UPI002235D2B4|nr:interleukin-13 receptor subunit alpha-2 [Antechinus flavipes]